MLNILFEMNLDTGILVAADGGSENIYLIKFRQIILHTFHNLIKLAYSTAIRQRGSNAEDRTCRFPIISRRRVLLVEQSPAATENLLHRALHLVHIEVAAECFVVKVNYCAVQLGAGSVDSLAFGVIHTGRKFVYRDTEAEEQQHKCHPHVLFAVVDIFGVKGVELYDIASVGNA